MSEIEKLYKNAEIEKQTFCSKTDTCYDGRLSECEGCNAYHYPPFTAKKQLEMIKWLIQEVDCLQLWHFSGKREAFDFDLGIINAKGATFEETLASLINTLWQDFTPEEKAEIKEILCE